MSRFSENLPFDYGHYFAAAAQFLHRYRWIFCSSNTKFIRCGVLDKLPQEWINDLHGVSNEEFNQIPLGLVKSWCDSFKAFIHDVQQLQVRYDEHDNNHRPVARKGISAKKAYEIENLCSFIEKTRSSQDPAIFVDFGSGLGYLSELIHERCSLQVLGIEGNAQLVQTCNKRQTELCSTSTYPVQYCHHFITHESFNFIEKELSTRFGIPSERSTACIAGLHACADLSITAIDCFLQCDWAKKLTVMPCCYHRMKTLHESDGACIFENIPLSNKLREALATDNRNTISRPFLRLGCQQTAARWKVRTAEEHMQHGRVMFRRGLVEAILDADESVHVGKMKQVPEETTVQNVLDQFTLRKQAGDERQECPWTDRHREKLSVLLERYGSENGPRLAEYLECLQTCLQSICENVILLDRMCYLEDAASRIDGLQIRRNLVRLRDDGLSPRCFVFYAAKV
uniref:Methyltranfer_dom domain-containing protein n=1 Tax=Anopheles dirus TaxID=7168 RepID=A0A182N7J7_9DIPT